MHNKCVTPGFGDSCICPGCTTKTKEESTSPPEPEGVDLAGAMGILIDQKLVPVVDRIIALEASVAILGKVSGEQEKTIENITSCLAETIETIELLRKLGE